MTNGVEDIQIDKWACTGVLASHPISSDLHIHNYSCTFHGQVISFNIFLSINDLFELFLESLY